MQVNLTINKPGATQFNDDAKGLKIKVEDGKISVKFVKTDSGAGVYPMFDRTRGGVGVTLTGSIVEKLLAVKGVEADTHMTMEATSYGWLVATPHESKPSKLVPTLRLWNVRDEVGDKAEVAPVAKKAAPKASRGGTKAKAKAKPRAKKAAVAEAAAQ
jgi:hypothetical protein